MDAWQDIEKAEEQFLNTLADLGGLAPETAVMLRHCARLIKQMKARLATPKPAGAVPTIRAYAEIRGTDDPDVFEENLWAWMKGMPVPEGENITLFCALDDAIRYGNAREAAARDAMANEEVGDPANGDACTKAFERGRKFEREAAGRADAVPAAIDPDDIAVDRFAAAMKEKMAAARAKGRGGWEGPTCNPQLLSDMLRDHVAKGDPRDVANFCMMLWNRSEAIQVPKQMTTQGEDLAVIIASELARIDGYDPEDQHGGLYELRWTGFPTPEPEGDAWNLDYLPKGERIAKAITGPQP